MIVYPYYIILVFEYKNKGYEKYKLKKMNFKVRCLLFFLWKLNILSSISLAPESESLKSLQLLYSYL